MNAPLKKLSELAGVVFEQPMLEANAGGSERFTAAGRLAIRVAHRCHYARQLRLH